MGRAVLLFATATACALAFGGCNSLKPKLDGAAIERGIEQDAHSQFSGTGAKIGAASCPRGRVQRKGDRFDCHITIDGQVARYEVRQTDGHGTVHPALASHYLLFTTINDQTLADLRSQGLDDAKVACGYTHVWFVTPPVSRDCVVTLANGTAHTAHVSLAADGGVKRVDIPGLSP